MSPASRTWERVRGERIRPGHKSRRPPVTRARGGATALTGRAVTCELAAAVHADAARDVADRDLRESRLTILAAPHPSITSADLIGQLLQPQLLVLDKLGAACLQEKSPRDLVSRARWPGAVLQRQELLLEPHFLVDLEAAAVARVRRNLRGSAGRRARCPITRRFERSVHGGRLRQPTSTSGFTSEQRVTMPFVFTSDPMSGVSVESRLISSHGCADAARRPR